MSIFFFMGPRARARAAVRVVVVVGASFIATIPTSVLAGSQKFKTFSGELDYGTFQQAAGDHVALRITYSPGGSGAAAMALGRVPSVVIDGECNSACAWAFVRNSNACFTPRASFGFHAAHDPGTGMRLNAATEYWMATVRPGLLETLQPLLTSSQVIRVGGAKMRAVYGDRMCGAAKPRTEVADLQARESAREKVSPPKTISLASLRDELNKNDASYPLLLQAIAPPLSNKNWQDAVARAALVEVGEAIAVASEPADHTLKIATLDALKGAPLSSPSFLDGSAFPSWDAVTGLALHADSRVNIVYSAPEDDRDTAPAAVWSATVSSAGASWDWANAMASTFENDPVAWGKRLMASAGDLSQANKLLWGEPCVPGDDICEVSEASAIGWQGDEDQTHAAHLSLAEASKHTPARFPDAALAAPTEVHETVESPVVVVLEILPADSGNAFGSKGKTLLTMVRNQTIGLGRRKYGRRGAH